MMDAFRMKNVDEDVLDECENKRWHFLFIATCEN